MENEYSIENLISRFKIHYLYAMKEQKEREEKHQREYGKPFPKDGPDPDFNISFALMNICENIKELNEWKEFTEMD